MGIIKSADMQSPKQSIIYPFCKVGTGYSIEDLEQLRANLKMNWKKYDPRSPPGYMWEWKPAMQERPDVYIDDPSLSVVLEVKAGEIVSSDQYPTKYTLRFPRVVKIRYDKSWNDSMTAVDLKSMLENYEENRRLKRKSKAMDLIGEDKAVKKTKRQKAKQEFNILLPNNRDTDTSNVAVVTSIFNGCVFYIVNLGPVAEENKITKPILETFIAQHGGTKVQNYMPSVTHVVAEEIDYKVQNLIKSIDCNVIHYAWVIKCIETQSLQEFIPRYYVHTNEQTKARLQENVDQYGDHYYVETDANKLEELFATMGTEFNEEDTTSILKVSQ